MIETLQEGIQKTFDYEIFKSITSNREVDERHVNRLVKAIKKHNLLHINPIICNENLEIIDGQHRLEAAKIIGGIYIYYIIDNIVSKQDIALINSNSKNWTIMDYINYWTIEKKPGFDKLSQFLYENPSIPGGTAIMLMSYSGNRDLNGLKNGTIDISNYQFAVDVAGILKSFRNKFDYAYDRSFIQAIICALNTPEYSHDTMMAKIELQPRSVVKCINKKQYVEMLEEIYNYKSRNPIKLNTK